MALTGDDIWHTARLTLRDPKRGVRIVMGWPLTTGDLWLVLALLATLSTLLAEAMVALSAGEVDPAMAVMLAAPLGFAALQFAGLGVMAVLLFALGRPFGGTGQFPEALAAVGWLQCILLVVQIVQIIAILVLPVFALLIAVGSLGLAIWLLTNFTAELHGFRSLFLTLLAIIAAFIGMVVLLSVAMIVVFGVGA